MHSRFTLDPAGDTLVFRRRTPGWSRVWIWAASATAAAGLGTQASAAEFRPNVVIVTLDTTRADHLGCYGYPRPTSPHLDQLCEQSQVYTRGFATSSWTLSSHASLFTGKFLSSHGARHDKDGPLALTDAIDHEKKWGILAVRPLAESQTTLAEILLARGYRTGAVVAGPWMKKMFGLAQGFSSYDESEITSQKGRRAASVTRAAVEFLEQAEVDDPSPFFLFLNYYDPHSPYKPPRDFARRFVRSLPGGIRDEADWKRIALYDAEIAYMDEHIGKFLARLRELGEFDDTLLVVTADHGELLGEHGEWGHGRHLYQQEIAIPLIVKPPSGDGPISRRRIDQPVQLVDVLPLVLSQTGIPMPGDIQGETPGKLTHPIVAEVYPHHTAHWVGDWQAAVQGTSKLLCNSLGNDEVFDLALDPGETRNLVETPPTTAWSCDALRQYLESLPRIAPTDTKQLVDEETKKALESLGYLE